jgi:ribonuclease HI
MSSTKSVVVHTDGASRGNPGPASIGVVIAGLDGRVLAEFGEALRPTTNNVAEYTAVIRALERAAELGARAVRVMMDSQLVVRQLNGSYRVKHPEMIPLYRRVLELIQRFDDVTFEHVPREQNVEADRLANQALDGGEVPVEGAPAASEALVARLFNDVMDGVGGEAADLLANAFRYQRSGGPAQDAGNFLSGWHGRGERWTISSVRAAGVETILEARRGTKAVLWLCQVVNGKVERVIEYRDDGV